VSDRFDWDTLRNDVADVQRPLAEDDELLRKARARLLLTERVVPLAVRRQPKRWLWVTTFAAAAALVLTLAALRREWRSEPSLSFVAGNATVAGQVGAWLSPTGREAMPIRFSDGTLVLVAPQTRARVVRTMTRGADIALEQGSLSLAVVHHEAGEWHVGAGPFTVLVTGTKFDVGWNAAERTFTLALHEGSVLVSGPTLSGAGRRMKPGEALRIAIDERAVALPAPGVVGGGASPNGAPSASDDSAKLPGKNPVPGARGSWKELAQRQDYTGALAAAEAEGFESTCKAASAPDLVLLGNSARFAGSAARAEQAFRLVRSRFVGSHEAATAAFFLGRIAYDQRGSRREAVQWFQSYLREAPSGALTREALGRLLEAERALGDVEAARAYARQYLEKYPSGPHASLAHDLLGQ
jgi:transmembrane sensor